VLGAVIITHRRPDLALSCLRSLEDTVDGDHVVVVINDPAGANAAEVAAVAELASVIRNPAPAGYAANINRGVRALGADVDRLLLLNDDLRFDAGAVMRLSNAVERSPAVAVASPALVGEDGTDQAVAFQFPSIRTEVAQMLIAPARVLAMLRNGDASAAQPGSSRADWVLGAAMLVRRDAFDAVDGFDEGFVMYSEETDFCRRLADLGWGCVACGDARALHVGGASTPNSNWARVRARSRQRYLVRHWSSRQRLALAVLFLLASAWNLVYVIASSLLRPGRRATYIRALRTRVAERVTLRSRVPAS